MAAADDGAHERVVEYQDGATPETAAYILQSDLRYMMRIRNALTRACMRLSQAMDEVYKIAAQRKASPLVLAGVAARAVFTHFGVRHAVRPVYRVTRKLVAPEGIEQAALDERLQQSDYCVRHLVVLCEPPPLYSTPDEAPEGLLLGVPDPRGKWITLEAGDAEGAVVPPALASWLVTDLTSLETRARSIICGTPVAIEREKVADVLMYTPAYAETPVGTLYKSSKQAGDAEVVSWVTDFEAQASEEWRKISDNIVALALKESDAKTDHLAHKFHQKAAEEAHATRVRQHAKARQARDRAARRRVVTGSGVPQLALMDDVSIPLPQASAPAPAAAASQSGDGSVDAMD